MSAPRVGKGDDVGLGDVRPQVVAHRGASHDHPEHTLGAYLRAISAGADALECDVRMTADGHLVCVHDRRIDRTSSGRGRVSTLELARLEGLDWASWKGDRDLSRVAELPDRDRGRLLTLRTLLSTVADCGRPVEVAVETKHPTRYAGLVEQELFDVLDSFGWARPRPGAPSRARVMSSSTRALARMRSLAPGLPLVRVVERVPVPLPGAAHPRGLSAVAVSVPILRDRPRYLRRLRRLGYGVHVWTVDEPEDVDRCVEAGVDAVITNRPGAVLARLGRGGDGGTGGFVPFGTG